MRLRTLILSAACSLSLAGVAAAQTPAAQPAPATPAPSAPADAQPAATPAPASTGAPFAQISPAPGQDIVAVLTASGQFTTLLKALTATGLTPVLKNPNLTVFAPTDAAFAALPPGQLDTWMQTANLPTLQKALAYHVVNAPIALASAKGHQTKVATAAGTEIWVDGTFEPMKINDANVLQADVAASNGHIWVIDKIAQPGFTPPAPGPQAQGVPDPNAADAAAAASASTTAATTTKKTTTTKKKK